MINLKRTNNSFRAKKIHANNRQIEDKIVKVRLKFQTPNEVHNVFQIINKIMCSPTPHH